MQRHSVSSAGVLDCESDFCSRVASHLISSSIVVVVVVVLRPSVSSPGIMIIRRTFFRFPSAAPATSLVYRKRFNEDRLLGWSNEQLFALVSNVDEYQYFLPACIRSSITRKVSDREIIAELEIGVPPFIRETYVSHIRLDPPVQLTAASPEGRLFHHLNTMWRFTPGVNGQKRTTLVNFSLDFEFKSRIYAELVSTVFDQAAKQTMSAFMGRAETLYGPPFPVDQSRRLK